MANQDGLDATSDATGKAKISIGTTEVPQTKVEILVKKEADKLNSLYREGHKAGYETGHTRGYQAGWGAGYREGQSKGYQSGYAKALERTLKQLNREEVEDET